MGKFRATKINFSGLTYTEWPPLGQFLFGFDSNDDFMKKIDSVGNITIIGDGIGSGGTGTDTFVTGGTYNTTGGTATFTNNTGGTFNVSGFLTGATGGNSSKYGFLYTQNDALIVNGETVVFDEIVNNDGITFTGDTITLEEIGKYRIDFILNIPADYRIT